MKICISLTISLLFITFALSAQKRSGSIHIQIPNNISTDEETANVLPQRKDMNIFASNATANKNPEEVIDTLNYPLAGTYALYTLNDGGYVSGNNSFGDLAKANIFEYNQPSILKGVLIDFAHATNNTISIEIAAWDDSGPNQSPGNKIASTTIPLDDIFIDVLNNQTTYIPFETPVLMTATFYIGVVLPSGSDELALYTNTDGDTNPSEAWELWNDGDWYRYDNQDSWQYDMAHAIFPIVDSDVGLMANFFASSTAINPGTSIDFFDTSIGDPLSWSWTFEGGEPDSSVQQEPMVSFAEEGLYDVQLIVGNGETFDTLVREDYILVTEEIPVETDTLLYPLDGNRVIYEIEDDQGVSLGFICGNNVYGDIAKANYFSLPEDVTITGMLLDFAVAVGNDQPITFAIWNNQGTNGEPGSIVQSTTLPMNTIKSDVTNNMMTQVVFDPPVSMSHPFYAGIQLPTNDGDTLAFWSNTDGNTFPGVAWDQWEDEFWVPISHANSWGINIAMGIHPIVEYVTGTNDHQLTKNLAIYPNPTSGKFQVDLSAFTDSKTVEVVNMTGAVLFSQQLGPDKTAVQLDLSDQFTGIYFVRVVSATLTGVQKVIRH